MVRPGNSISTLDPACLKSTNGPVAFTTEIVGTSASTSAKVFFALSPY